MKKGFKILLALALIAVLALPNTFSVLANNDNDEQEFKSEIIITKQGDQKDDNTRAARTQIWEQSGIIYGGHESESSINEDIITVDGGLKINGQGYTSTSDDHTTGYWAYCTTSMSNPEGTQQFVAHSWHYFYDATWPGWSGQTQKTLIA
jgi:hypothetical protein